MKKILENLIFLYPLLIAGHPILYLYNINKFTTPFSHIFFPLFSSFLFALVLLIVFFQFFKNIYKTTIAVSLFIFLFFIFEIFAGYIKANTIVLLLIFVVLFSSLIALIYVTRKKLLYLNYYLATTSFLLFFIPLTSATSHYINNHYQKKEAESTKIIKQINKKKNYPDIYYIILDGYARHDILEKYYNFNNKELLHFLKSKGFYIAEESTANYPQTYLSLSSSLNFEYINYISNTIGEKSKDKKLLREKIINNKASSYLKNHGYKYVAFFSEYSATEKNNYADIYIDYKNKLNYFDFAVINMTPLKLLFGEEYHFNEHRNRIKYIFEKLPEVADIKGPTFTFVHFYTPHPPFVFDQKGDSVNPTIQKPFWDFISLYPCPEEYRQDYINQLIFINSLIKKMVNEIINKSDSQPIIMLQSDHGPSSMYHHNDLKKSNLSERFSIFNAYLIPEGNEKKLYDSITPINSFRIIFNLLFDEKIELLEDKNYYSSWSKPYKFIEITDKLKTEEN